MRRTHVPPPDRVAFPPGQRTELVDGVLVHAERIAGGAVRARTLIGTLSHSFGVPDLTDESIAAAAGWAMTCASERPARSSK